MDNAWPLHHLETHTEDIKMSNGFNNPYMSQSENPYGFQYQTYSMPGEDIYSAMSSIFMPGNEALGNPASVAFSDIFSNPLYYQGYIDEYNVSQGDFVNPLHAQAGWETGQAHTWDDLQLPTIEGGFHEQGLLPVTDVFDPESIAASLSFIADEDIKSSEIQALTPEMIEKTESKYYDPYEKAEREGLVEKLGKSIGGAETGGFAGSGARQSGLSAAERMYSSGYGDLLADIMKMRGSATEDVMDRIYSWAEHL